MPSQTDVLYNESCPICRREIDHYARLNEAAQVPIRFDPLGNADPLRCWGIAPEEAARRLHVRQGGQIYAGIPAFIVLWRALPRYRWLARLVSLPGVHWMACRFYDHLLAPLLFRWHLKRQGVA